MRLRPGSSAGSARREKPRQMTVEPGGGSAARSGYPPGRAIALTWTSRSRGLLRFRSGVARSGKPRSASAKTAAGDAPCVPRPSIVSHGTRQATMRHRAMPLVRRSAVAGRISSIRQPAFRVLRKAPVLQRSTGHSRLCTACAWLSTGRFVIGLQKTGARPSGGSSSSAWMIRRSGVGVSAACRPAGGPSSRHA